MKDNKYNKTGLNPERFRSVIRGKKTDLYILRNRNGMEVCVTNYGGIILSIVVPDKFGDFKNVVLGFDNIDEVIKQSINYYIGAVIGPVAGRIYNGYFNIDGKEYNTPLNTDKSMLHSGEHGFHSVVWDVSEYTEKIICLNYLHENGYTGIPGNIQIKLKYTLSEDNELRIDYWAQTDSTTIFAPTHHSYFNLSGINTPTETIENHLLKINSKFYLPINEYTNNTGEICTIKETPFDFTDFHRIGERINDTHLQLQNGKGYDHCFVLNKTYNNELSFAATCVSPISGRRMDVYTTEPGLIVYSSNYLPDMKGMQNTIFSRRCAICLETQRFPDTSHNLHFPSIILNKDKDYNQTTIYKFIIEK